MLSEPPPVSTRRVSTVPLDRRSLHAAMPLALQVALARRFGRDQNEAEHLIAMLEARSETA